MMAMTGRLVLPPDVVLTPVGELPPQVRRQFEAGDDDYAVTRLRSRTPSKIVGSELAALLREFRQPKTIVEAVIAFSRVREREPERTLEDAFPSLERFVRSRILVPPGSEDAGRIVATYGAGAIVAGFEIISPVQILDDSEVYRVRAAGVQAALKIARDGRQRDLAALLEREAAVLRRLDGRVTPACLANGTVDDRPYVAMAWRGGRTVDAAAMRIRTGDLHEGTKWMQLRQLCVDVVAAYAHLHGQGVIHGDVHPRNVLVDADGGITILDFGYARVEPEDVGGDLHRAGVAFFYDPELAAAQRARRRSPRSTFGGEQYALAALAYLLMSGGHYLDFSVERQEMLRQIVDDAPLTLRQRGIAWDALDAVLATALAKQPPDRFASVAEFAHRLADAPAAAVPASANGAASSPFDATSANAIVSDVLARFGPDGELFRKDLPSVPYSSVTYGAAGVAHALYRIACARGDAEALSAADVWASRAAARASGPAAFYNAEIHITAATVGAASLYHTACGMHAVQALVAQAMGDVVSQQSAFDAFVAAGAATENLDLTLGRSGILLGAALLADLPASFAWLNRAPLLAFGDEIAAAIWREIDAMPPIGAPGPIRFLGIAHGWAGILYATLCWCAARGVAPPASLATRLHELGECGDCLGPGIRWRVKLSRDGRRRGPGAADEYMTSWCNGSPGHVFLWTIAHRAFGDEEWLTLAERAAHDVWNSAGEFDSLCCGLSGGAYALLNLFRHTGDAAWLRRAAALANRAIAATRRSEMPNSLYKGTVGVAALAADLSDPHLARMPLFEPESWSRALLRKVEFSER
jgi:serine/threonine protein kinase